MVKRNTSWEDAGAREANARFAALMEAAPELRVLLSRSFRFPVAPPWKTALCYLASLTVTGICTGIALLLYPRLNAASIAMLYVLGTAVVALGWGQGPATWMSVANVVLLDYLFIPPRLSLNVADPSNYVTLAVMLCVALVIAQLVSALQRQRMSAELRERRTGALYEMSRQLCSAADAESILLAATRHISRVFDAGSAVLTADDQGRLSLPPCFAPPARGASRLDEMLRSAKSCDRSVADDAIKSGSRVVGNTVYVPLRAYHGVKAVLVVSPLDTRCSLFSEQLSLLEAFASQIALALQSARLAEQGARLAEAAEQARITGERALVCNSLLSSISHDLRTPLAAIAGAGNLIAQPRHPFNSERLTTLGQLIERKAFDMSNLIAKILQLAKLELAEVRLKTDWHSIEDLVAHSLRVNASHLSQHLVVVNLPADLPLIEVEATLIVQILNNLLENAAKYTPQGTRITISAAVGGDNVVISVADDGPGLGPGDASRLFDRFKRSHTSDSRVGLGLAICRTAARLHGGDIRAASDPAMGGARFEITLPVSVSEAATAHLDYAMCVA